MMKTLGLFSVLILFSAFLEQSTAANSTSRCGADWEPFKDDHCYKIADQSNLHTFADAEKICQQTGATLVDIRSKEEQDFLVNLFFIKNKVVDNVWIGAKFEANEKKFRWIQDNSTLVYTNWVKGHPNNLADYCVQLHTDGDSVGEWVDKPCEKKNLVICEKGQILPIARLQDIVLELREEVRHELRQEIKQEVNLLTDQLKKMRENPVPIGFTYVQLPGEESPSTIWPLIRSWQWTDVSPAYAGVFFRVEGGGAATFGSIQQEENAPRLIGVETWATNASNSYQSEIETPPGKWSVYVRNYKSFSPNDINSFYDVMRFNISGGEVRPKNMAIKVWRRSA